MPLFTVTLFTYLCLICYERIFAVLFYYDVLYLFYNNLMFGYTLYFYIHVHVTREREGERERETVYIYLIL